MKKKTKEEIADIALNDPVRFYHLSEWLSTRAFVLRRDHNECMRCIGKWKSDIPLKKFRIRKATHVHHIKALKDHPELCLDPDNLISLCFGCHEDVERRGISKEKKIPLTLERW